MLCEPIPQNLYRAPSKDFIIISYSVATVIVNKLILKSCIYGLWLKWTTCKGGSKNRLRINISNCRNKRITH